MFNYEFPVIYNIHDVLPHIEGRDEFRVFEKDGYTVINYMVGLDTTFEWNDSDPLGSSMRRECRGITFDSSGQLITRKYHKFFNVGEREETQLNKINLYEPHVILQKLDGSLISAQPTSYGFRLNTKAGITDVAMNAEVFIANKRHYSQFIRKCLQKGFSPLFEWCSRKNRIVIDYPEDQLILTGLRANQTGEYVNYSVMAQYATAWNIPVVKVIDGLSIQNIELMVNQIREWEDDEGVVLRFDSGHMGKIKADDYCLRHKSKEAINQEKNVIGVIANDLVDDLIPLLTSEDSLRLQDFQKKFWMEVNNVSWELNEIYVPANLKYPNQRDFAVEFVQKQVPSRFVPFMYGMKQGKSSMELVIDKIKSSLGSSTTVDKVRWLFGNLHW